MKHLRLTKPAIAISLLSLTLTGTASAMGFCPISGGYGKPYSGGYGPGYYGSGGHGPMSYGSMAYGPGGVAPGHFGQPGMHNPAYGYPQAYGPRAAMPYGYPSGPGSRGQVIPNTQAQGQARQYGMPHGAVMPSTSSALAMTPPAKDVAQASPEGQAAAISIQSMRFGPGVVTVPKGTTVTWTNNDAMPHNVIGNGFQSPVLNRGQSFSHTFNESGTYAYQCSLHPGMTGTVSVE